MRLFSQKTFRFNFLSFSIIKSVCKPEGSPVGFFALCDLFGNLIFHKKVLLWFAMSLVRNKVKSLFKLPKGYPLGLNHFCACLERFNKIFALSRSLARPKNKDFGFRYS